VDSLAARLGLALTRIGSARAEAGLVVRDDAGAEVTLEKTGWTHF
jgi:hypothetical protein